MPSHVPCYFKLESSKPAQSLYLPRIIARDSGSGSHLQRITLPLTLICLGILNHRRLSQASSVINKHALVKGIKFYVENHQQPEVVVLLSTR
jgi:hypothetical protein